MNLPVFTFFIGITCMLGYTCATTTYRMCVPHHIFNSCKEVASKSTRDVKFECISGRDRMECLEKVQKREADFLAADPEDMYVAFGMKNEDFSIFSELRTTEESGAEFRYEGIILTRKNNGINSMADLVGKKSCHTGYGRNVGYKIPITRLKKLGILKVSADTGLSSVEKELKGLSEIFNASCLVGKYSPDAEVNRVLKSKYSSLCALCEDPVKCDYPDKFSGYDGSIRCLVENGGDIAFTKVIYVRRFFGLPIGNNPATTEARANPDDYEYLCEDGTRRSVTERPCSWAKRPWQGFMSNGDVNPNVKPLQTELRNWYGDGLEKVDKVIATDMWIDNKHTVVDKDTIVLPGDHLESALYKDVIERDGSTSQKIRLCVKTAVEMRKCETLRKAAFSRDIRPEFRCVESRDCLKSVREKEADVAVLSPSDFHRAHDSDLKKIMKETLNPDSVYVIVADEQLSSEIVQKLPIAFDRTDSRASDVAATFNHARNINTAIEDIQSSENAQIRIVHSSRLSDTTYTGKKLVCSDFTFKPLTEAKSCNFDGRLTRGIFVRTDIGGMELDSIVHGFKSLSDKFGHNANLENVFELFGEFEKGARNVIFTDDGQALENDDKINVIINGKEFGSH